MRIAFYCEFNYNSKIDLKEIEMGNIGLGGAQYLFLLVANNLEKKDRKNKYYMISNKKLNIKNNAFIYKDVKNENDLFNFCRKEDITYLVVRDNYVTTLRQKQHICNKTKYYIWAHNHVGKEVQKEIKNNKNIIKLVCVSKQQYLNMRNSICYKKCCYINNCLGSYIDNIDVLSLKFSNNLYLVSAIEPSRGILEALKIFMKINKHQRNSNLYIIGGLGTLRSKEITIGESKISYPKYEEKLKRYIHKNNIDNKVHFLGILPSKKIKEMMTEKGGIGLVDLSHINYGETFCMSALEMESYGIPIAFREKNDGLKTSVKKNFTGICAKTNFGIAKKIVKLLNKQEVYNEYSTNCKSFAKEFSITKISEQWINLFKKEINTIQKRNLIKVIFYYVKDLKDRVNYKIVMNYYKNFMR